MKDPCKLGGLSQSFGETFAVGMPNLPSREEEEHQKKIAKLPKKPIRLPGGKLVYLR